MQPVVLLYPSQILSQTPSHSNTAARSGGSNLGYSHTPERRPTTISLNLHSTNHQPSHSYQRPGSDFFPRTLFHSMRRLQCPPYRLGLYFQQSKRSPLKKFHRRH
ncbi:hypothetical protein TNCV_4488241 [Trichonephila clavipes]|nr:hypothetical protein TNCV_4488241 [Trichonephila clavipes]